MIKISNNQLSKFTACSLKKRTITRNKFQPSEDALIRQLVEQYGPNFEIIEQAFSFTRTRRQLRERWQNYLAPTLMIIQQQQQEQNGESRKGNDGDASAKGSERCDIKKKLFTEEENKVLMEQYELIGPKWAQISRVIGGKSAVLVRNQWRRLTKKVSNGLFLDFNQLTTNSPILEKNEPSSSASSAAAQSDEGEGKTNFDDLFDFQFLNDFDLDCFEPQHLNAGANY